MPTPHPTVGINAKRGCTDCPMLLLYLIVLGGMGYLSYLAITNGNPDRLLYGTDYMGNMCGSTNPAPVNISLNMTEWAARKLLWYPITYDYRTESLVLKDALSMGICGETCPNAGDVVQGYGTVSDPSSTASFYASTHIPKWPVLFSSNETFFRCVPDFLSFNCGGGNASMSTSASNCVNSLVGAAEQFGNSAHLTDIAQKGFAEIRDNWWVILASVGIVIGVSFVWLVLVRCFVKPIVIFTLFLVLVALGGGGALCWYFKGLKANADPPQPQASDYFMYGAIVLWILTFLYICLVIFMWRDIMTACDIIEEASKVPVSIPTMVLLPPFLMILVIPLIAFHGVIAVYIQSSGDSITASIPIPVFLNYTNGTVTSSFPNASAFANELQRAAANGSVDSFVQVRQYTFQNWREYGHLYNLFSFLWSFGFINAIGFMTLAFCGIFWYYSNPGDDKSPPCGSVLIGLRMCLRYHIGTLAFGSLLVALVQLIRVLALLIEQRLKELGQRTEAVHFAFKCIHCCLACLERVIKFINKNAYIVCAMKSENFLSSCRTAIELIGANALSVGAVSVIGEYVMLFGKIVITAATVVASWYIMQRTGGNTGITSGILVLIIVGVIAFFIASLFICVFSVCIDTILLCFCYDKMHPEHAYFPKDLAQHVSKAQQQKEGLQPRDAKGKHVLEEELTTPLHSAGGARAGQGRKTVNDEDL